MDLTVVIVVLGPAITTIIVIVVVVGSVATASTIDSIETVVAVATESTVETEKRSNHALERGDSKKGWISGFRHKYNKFREIELTGYRKLQ